jgi:mannose-6-phosphate isomerase-like protein (cupin superfamily)
MYATDGLPTLTGREADPVPAMTNLVPGPQGSRFRLFQIPPRSLAKPDPAAIDRMLEEYRAKVPRIGEHLEKQDFGMHTTETVDYVVVIRGEINLELDDGKTVHLRQADCVIQNGTRHAWRNPFSEPCLLAAVMIGAQRERSSGAGPS